MHASQPCRFSSSAHLDSHHISHIRHRNGQSSCAAAREGKDSLTSDRVIWQQTSHSDKSIAQLVSPSWVKLHHRCSFLAIRNVHLHQTSLSWSFSGQRTIQSDSDSLVQQLVNQLPTLTAAKWSNKDKKRNEYRIDFASYFKKTVKLYQKRGSSCHRLKKSMDPVPLRFQIFSRSPGVCEGLQPLKTVPAGLVSSGYKCSRSDPESACATNVRPAGMLSHQLVRYIWFIYSSLKESCCVSIPETRDVSLLKVIVPHVPCSQITNRCKAKLHSTRS